MAPQEYGVVNMKVVSSELANRRRDRRVEAPLINIQIEGMALATIDWSLGGFLVEGYDGSLRAGDHATVEIEFEIDGREFHNVVPIEVVRIDPYGNQLAANFRHHHDHAGGIADRPAAPPDHAPEGRLTSYSPAHRVSTTAPSRPPNAARPSAAGLSVARPFSLPAGIDCSRCLQSIPMVFQFKRHLRRSPFTRRMTRQVRLLV